jgi:hypothetical protein
MVLAAASTASAHKMFVDAKVDGARIHVEAFYDGNQPAADAQITLENEATKEVVAQGATDERGTWSCPAPPPGNYVVRGASKDAHTATCKLPEAAFLKPAPASAPANPQKTATHPPESLSRDEQTSTPFLKIVLGLGAIVILFTVLWLSRRKLDVPEV